MNKFQKMMSVTLAGCMAASALMGSAGAVNIPTDTSPAYMAEDSQVTTHILSFEEMNAITPYKTESAQVFSGAQQFGWRSGHRLWRIYCRC